MTEKVSSPTVIVAGSGRCGSSLVCQMLAAGGAPMAPAPWPSFENAELHDSIITTGTLGVARGRVVKLLYPMLREMPLPSEPIRWLWVSRRPREQARSQVKWMRALLQISDIPREIERGIIRQVIEEREEHKQRVRQMPGHTWIPLRFELILADPARVAEKITALTGLALDVDAMVRAVVPRSPECFDGLLEGALIHAQEVCDRYGVPLWVAIERIGASLSAGASA